MGNFQVPLSEENFTLIEINVNFKSHWRNTVLSKLNEVQVYIRLAQTWRDYKGCLSEALKQSQL